MVTLTCENGKMAMNPLANPKGVKTNCELCNKPAFIQCVKCRVTYYCGEEHQTVDWIGIHEKICQLLIPLRTTLCPTSGLGDEREHAIKQTRQRQEALLHITTTAAQRLLFEKQYEYVIPAALQSVKFTIDIHGMACVELVPSYLMLGEAYIGLGKLAQAEEYMSQAQWTILKTPECSNIFKSKLFRILGLLNASQGNNNDALKYMAEDIYHSAMEFGPDAVQTAGGYYNMANIFISRNNIDTGFSLYQHVINIWQKFLHQLIDERTIEQPGIKGIGPIQLEDIPCITTLDEAQEAEAIQALTSIINEYEKQSMHSSPAIKRVYHCLAMLYMILNDLIKAKSYLEKALAISGSTKTTSNTDLELTSLLELINKNSI